MKRAGAILALLLFAGNSAAATDNLTTYIHSGGHLLPDDVPPVIVKFFKQQAKP